MPVASLLRRCRVVLVGARTAQHHDRLTKAGFDVLEADVDRAAQAVDPSVDAVVLAWDEVQPDPRGLCRRLRENSDAALIFVGGGLGDAIAALRTTADDFLPVGPEDEADAIARAIERRALRRRLAQLESGTRSEDRPGFDDIVGESPPMHQLRDKLARIQDSDVSVLLSGEPGTGKEVVAHSLHKHGARASRPFVAINCAAVPSRLLESEFFGHVKGAFTGARAGAQGMFGAASGGTLFLDEVGAMPLELQPKLLRALQERHVRPVGSSSEVAIDVRVLSASNVDLAALVARGEFREDLFYRLNVFELTLPPLRERGADVLLLAYHFLERAAPVARRNVIGFTPAAARALLAYDWPGNVRELENCVEAAVAVTRFDHVTDADLPAPISSPKQPEVRLVALEQLEREHIERVMRLTRENKAEAARLLGITRKTLYRKLRRYGLEEHRPRMDSQAEA